MEVITDRTTRRLGDHLLEAGLISQNMLDVALAEQHVTGELLGKILVRSGFLTQKDLIQAIHRVDMNQLSSERSLVTRCPPEVLLESRTMILAETDDSVFLATLEDEQYVRSQMRIYYTDEDLVFNPVNMDLLDEYLDALTRIVRNEGALVDRLLRRALRDSVTDVHIQPRTQSYSVFFRYLGVLKHAHEGDLDEYSSLVAQIKDRSRIDIAERRIPQDGAFQVEHNGRMVDMRVATVPTVDGEKVVVRLLDPDSVNPKLEGLGITRLPKWRAGFSNADGICLVCGPTGSGKTTTLNGTVREMDRFGKSINTLEDPVEYRIPYVTQVNINHVVGLDFARGVRAFMRADPEVIICGEIRDIETARNAIKASETGHMVLGTLHTGSIRGTIDRIRDIGVEVSDLRYLLRAILVQRLIRTFCHHCKGEKCDHCYHTGFGGRSVISEVEYFSGPEDVDRMVAGEVWWPTMIDDAIDKVSQGVTSPEEVFRVFGEQGRARLNKAGYKLEQEELYG
ncbi:MAG: Flp pilus assembly complex ATPase component TadA [Halomonadaceae bacterium]|nr:Flp pilus assembly complex ATPase component TadA [Halomonadaceae bacterium]